MLNKKLLVFLNIDELKQICNKYNISYNIYIEKNDKIIKTNEIDHKIIIIENILKYLKNKIKPNITLYKKKIINYNKLDNINKNNFIYYGQYKTTNIDILKLMKSLTNNKFHFGAISQKIIRLLWRKNKLITFEEFADKWMKEYNKGINYEELAYNQFMKKNGNIKEWYKKKE